MYSALVVDKAVIVYILDAQVIGAPAKWTIQPDLDLDVIWVNQNANVTWGG